ncbi:MAG: hypothetical protein AAGJ46_20735 [Planctomycetota bacterium]
MDYIAACDSVRNRYPRLTIAPPPKLNRSLPADCEVDVTAFLDGTRQLTDAEAQGVRLQLLSLGVFSECEVVPMGNSACASALWDLTQFAEREGELTDGGDGRFYLYLGE